MMHMTFYWGKNVTVLFDFWKVDSWTSYALTLFACFLFSAFYQYMEDRRLRFNLASSHPAAAAADQNKSDSVTTPLLRSVGSGLISARFAGAMLFGVNSAVGYFLMLAVMSFNAGVFIAVVVGLAVGYLIFRSGGDENVVVLDNPCACA